MFKKLREKLADEVRQSPLRIPPGTFSFGNPTLQAVGDGKDEYLSEPGLSNEQQFSITEDDGTSSEMGSPHREANTSTSASSSKLEDTEGALFVPVLDTSNSFHSTYVLPSDLESEVEESIQAPPVLDDTISKEQLFMALNKLHARNQRYKAKYSKVADACKTANKEKEKIMRTLAANQDQMLRRMSELREQCNLEKQAKAHLEENLRLMLDEKEDMIGVLKTKIDLLKGGQNPDLVDEDIKSIKSVDSLSASDDFDSEKKLSRSGSQDESTSNQNESVSILENKVKRLEELLSRCKTALQSNKERSEQLTMERDRLSDQLEKKEQELLKIQEDESTVQSNLRSELSEMSERLIKLRKEQEEMGMAMAETKRSFHQELETREHRLSETQMELSKVKEELGKNQNLVQEERIKVEKMSSELEKTTKTLDEEKNELIQKLSESKAAAISLLKDQHQNALKDIEDDWKQKLTESEDKHKGLIEKENDLSKKHQDLLRELDERQIQNEATTKQLNDKIEMVSHELEKKNTEILQHTNALLSSKNEEHELVKTKLENLEADNNRMVTELEKLVQQNSQLKDMEVQFHNLKQKCIELENICEKSSTVEQQLETALEDKNELREKLLLLNSSMEKYVTQINDMALENSNFNSFITLMEETTLPLFNLFDDIKFDKGDLNLFGSSIKHAIERIVDDNASMTVKVNDLCNSFESQQKMIENLNREMESSERLINEKSVLFDEKCSTLNEVEQKLFLLEESSKDFVELQNKLSSNLLDLQNTKQELNSTSSLLESTTKEHEKLRFNFDELVSCSECKEIQLQKQIETLQVTQSNLECDKKELTQKLENDKKEISELQLHLEYKDSIVSDLQLQLKNKEVNLSEVECDKNKISEKFENFEKQISDLTLCLKSKESSLLELELKIKNQEERFVNEKSTISNDYTKLKEKYELILDVEKECAELKKSLNISQDKLTEKESVIAALNEKCDFNEDEIENLKMKCNSYDLKVKQLTSQIENLSTEKEALVKSIEDTNSSRSELLSQELESCRNKTSLLEKENLELAEKVNVLEDQHSHELAKCAKAFEELRVSAEEIKFKNNDLENNLLEKTSNCEYLKGKVSQLTEISEKLSDEMNYKDKKLDELEDECLELREGCEESKAIFVRLNDLRNELLELQKEKVELENTFMEHDSIRKKEKEQSASKLKNFEDRIQEYEKLQVNSEKQISQLEEKISMLDQEKYDLNRKLSEESTKLSESGFELDNLKQIIEKLNDEHVKLGLNKSEIENCSLEINSKLKSLENEVVILNDENHKLENCILSTESSLKDRNHVNAMLESKISQYESEIDALNIQLKEFETAHDSLQSGLTNSEKLKKNYEELEINFSKLENELVTKEEELKFSVEKISSIEQSCQDLQQSLIEKETNSNFLEGKLSDLETVLSNMKQEIDNKNSLIERNVDEFNGLRALNEELEKNVSNAQTFTTNTSEVTIELNELKERLLEVNNNHETKLKEVSEEHKEELNLKENLIASLQEELKLRNVQLDECLVVSEANSSGINQELEDSKSKIEDLLNENANLKTELIRLSSGTSTSDSIEVDLLDNLNVNSDEDYETRLKKLVKYFAVQMKSKEEDHEKELSEIRGRYHDLEEKLLFEKDHNLTGVEKRLSEQSAAIEEMREHFLLQIQEKDELIMMLQKDSNIPPKSDWDNNWEYEDEATDNSGQPPNEDGLQQRGEGEPRNPVRSDSLTTNHSMCANGRDSINKNSFGGNDFNSGLEPTEYLYLRNILLEYMMGKEPVTLAKVIAAVLRFPKEQTALILKREEARQHSTITTSAKW